MATEAAAAPRAPPPSACASLPATPSDVGRPRETLRDAASRQPAALPEGEEPSHSHPPLLLPQRREVSAAPIGSWQARREPELGALRQDLAEAQATIAQVVRQLRLQWDGLEPIDMADLELQMRGQHRGGDFGGERQGTEAQASQHRAQLLAAMQSQLEQCQSQLGAAEEGLERLRSDFTSLRQRQEMQAATILEEHLAQTDTINLLLRQNSQQQLEAAALLDRLEAVERRGLAAEQGEGGIATKPVADTGQYDGGGAACKDVLQGSELTQAGTATACGSPPSSVETDKDACTDTSARLARLVGQMDAGLRVEFTTRIQKLTADLQTEMVSKLSAQATTAEAKVVSVEARLKDEISRVVGDMRKHMEAELRRLGADLHSARQREPCSSRAPSPGRPPSPVLRGLPGAVLPPKAVCPSPGAGAGRSPGMSMLGSPVVSASASRALSPVSCQARPLTIGRSLRSSASRMAVPVQVSAVGPPAPEAPGLHSASEASTRDPSASPPLGDVAPTPATPAPPMLLFGSSTPQTQRGAPGAATPGVPVAVARGASASCTPGVPVATPGAPVAVAHCASASSALGGPGAAAHGASATSAPGVPVPVAHVRRSPVQRMRSNEVTVVVHPAVPQQPAVRAQPQQRSLSPMRGQQRSLSPARGQRGVSPARGPLLWDMPQMETITVAGQHPATARTASNSSRRGGAFTPQPSPPPAGSPLISARSPQAMGAVSLPFSSCQEHQRSCNPSYSAGQMQLPVQAQADRAAWPRCICPGGSSEVPGSASSAEFPGASIELPAAGSRWC